MVLSPTCRMSPLEMEGGEEKQKHVAKLEALQEDLGNAVREERYGDAAKLQAEIKALQTPEEKESEQKRVAKLRALKEALENVVKEERYHDAAKLQAQIQALQTPEEKEINLIERRRRVAALERSIELEKQKEEEKQKEQDRSRKSETDVESPSIFMPVMMGSTRPNQTPSPPPRPNETSSFPQSTGAVLTSHQKCKCGAPLTWAAEGSDHLKARLQRSMDLTIMENKKLGIPEGYILVEDDGWAMTTHQHYSTWFCDCCGKSFGEDGVADPRYYHSVACNYEVCAECGTPPGQPIPKVSSRESDRKAVIQKPPKSWAPTRVREDPEATAILRKLDKNGVGFFEKMPPMPILYG